MDVLPHSATLRETASLEESDECEHVYDTLRFAGADDGDFDPNRKTLPVFISFTHTHSLSLSPLSLSLSIYIYIYILAAMSTNKRG